jgi:hypothetical protein
VSIALIIVIITFSVTLYFGLPRLRDKRNKYYSGSFPVSETEEIIYKNAAIVVDSEQCADIGKNVAKNLQNLIFRTNDDLLNFADFISKWFGS